MSDRYLEVFWLFLPAASHSHLEKPYETRNADFPEGR